MSLSENPLDRRDATSVCLSKERKGVEGKHTISPMRPFGSTTHGLELVVNVGHTPWPKPYPRWLEVAKQYVSDPATSVSEHRQQRPPTRPTHDPTEPFGAPVGTTQDAPALAGWDVGGCAVSLTCCVLSDGTRGDFVYNGVPARVSPVMHAMCSLKRIHTGGGNQSPQRTLRAQQHRARVVRE